MKVIEQTSVGNILTVSDEPQRGIFVRPQVGFIKSTHSLSEAEYRKIEVFRATDYQIAMVRNGNIEVECNLELITLYPGDILVFCPGTLVSTKSKSSDYNATIISISSDAVKGLPAFGYRIITIKDSDIPTLYSSIIGSLLKEPNPPEPIILAVQSFLIYLIELKQAEILHTHKTDRRSEIFSSFVTLLNENGIQHHLSTFYANELHISLNYLNNIVKEKSGRTVYQWINDYLITEAKAVLIHTTNSIQQVSDDLNFPNSAFFCKYFKTHTGLTPSAFRKCK